MVLRLANGLAPPMGLGLPAAGRGVATLGASALAAAGLVAAGLAACALVASGFEAVAAFDGSAFSFVASLAAVFAALGSSLEGLSEDLSHASVPTNRNSEATRVRADDLMTISL